MEVTTSELIENKTTLSLEQVHNIFTQSSPDMIEGALTAVRVSGVSELLSFFVFMSFVVILYFFITKVYNPFVDKRMEEESCSDARSIQDFVNPIFILCMVVAFIIGTAQLLDIWAWVAILNPKIALIHQLTGF